MGVHVAGGVDDTATPVHLSCAQMGGAGAPCDPSPQHAPRHEGPGRGAGPGARTAGGLKAATGAAAGPRIVAVHVAGTAVEAAAALARRRGGAGGWQGMDAAPAAAAGARTIGGLDAAKA